MAGSPKLNTIKTAYVCAFKNMQLEMYDTKGLFIHTKEHQSLGCGVNCFLISPQVPEL